LHHFDLPIKDGSGIIGLPPLLYPLTLPFHLLVHLLGTFLLLLLLGVWRHKSCLGVFLIKFFIFLVSSLDLLALPLLTSLLAFPIATKLGHVLAVLAHPAVHPHAVVTQAAPLAPLFPSLALSCLLFSSLSSHLFREDSLKGSPHQRCHTGCAPLGHLLLLLLDHQLFPHPKFDSSKGNDGFHGRHMHQFLLILIPSFLVAKHLVHHKVCMPQ